MIIASTDKRAVCFAAHDAAESAVPRGDRMKPFLRSNSYRIVGRER